MKFNSFPIMMLMCAIVSAGLFSACGRSSDRQSTAFPDTDLEAYGDAADREGSAMATFEVVPDVAGATIKQPPSGAVADRRTSPELRSADATPSRGIVPFEMRIQNALKNAGYYDGPIDGHIYDDTREAIKSFQSNNTLKVDGIVGRRTWQVLKKYYYNSEEE
jgi:peptidoglycan hydrolase-like protein with peptidoglycan-binding domain